MEHFEGAICPCCDKVVMPKDFDNRVNEYLTEYNLTGICPDCQDIYYQEVTACPMRYGKEMTRELQEDDMAWWGGTTKPSCERVKLVELDEFISKPVCFILDDGTLRIPKGHLLSIKNDLEEMFPEIDTIAEADIVSIFTFFGLHTKTDAHHMEIHDIDTDGEFLYLHKVFYVISKYITSPRISNTVDITFGDGNSIRFMFQSKKLYFNVGRVTYSNKKMLEE